MGPPDRESRDSPESVTERPEKELEEALGAEVRSPVAIPKSYTPTDLSGHVLLRVELEDFAGPLDLLLDLIRDHDLDIFDIPIAFITDKYLKLIERLEDLPIDVAGEFLVMAAELAHIKSKMLLPPKEGVPVEAEEDEDEDPRAELVRRLLEHQKYREAADRLGARSQLGKDVFARAPAPAPGGEGFDPGFREASIFRLVEAMADVLSRLTPEKQHEIVADSVTLSERIAYVLERLERLGPRLSFIELFDGPTSRRVLVVTFLAILELVRTGALKVWFHGEDPSQLFVELAPAPQATSPQAQPRVEPPDEPGTEPPAPPPSGEPEPDPA